MKRLVLVGGGHAHLSVLHALARAKPAGVETVLVTPLGSLSYSGMLPGWMAGHYSQAQCQIDLQPWARAAQAHLEMAPLVGLDADHCCIALPNGRQLEYDLLSLDTGSEVDTSQLEMAGDKLLPVKPLAGFFAAWPHALAKLKARQGGRLVMVGGGAAGVELALAARHALTLSESDTRVDLVASKSGLLPGHAPGVRRRVQQALDQAGIVVHHQRAIGVPAGALLSDGRLLEADCVIAATGARAPRWLLASKLRLDENGFVAVDPYHRSLSHPQVYAAGDVCAREDTHMARSGVHAVHAGAALAVNLLATLTGGPLTAYTPRQRSLYLLASGPRHAIASWGSLSAQGAWVWHWKDRIDRRFIAQALVRA